MEEQEKKGIKVGLGNVFLIVFLTIILTTAVIVGAYFILIKPTQKSENAVKNDVANNTTANSVVNTVANTTVENNTTNVFKNYMDKSLDVTKKFVISNVEEKSESYVVTAYLLKDDYERISQETFNKIVNEGATISFRGKEYKFAENHFTELNDEYGYITLTSISGDSGTALAKIYDSNTKQPTNEYTFYQYAGKESYVKDYASSTPVKFEVKKDVKIGDAFETFYLDYAGKVNVKDYQNETLKQDETTTKQFFARTDIYNTTSAYGECVAYLLDDEVVAIQTFTGTAP